MILGVFRIGVGFRRSGKLESGLFDQLDRIVLADISGLCLLFLRYVGTAPVVDDTQYAARLQRRVKILEGRIDLVPVEPVVEITKGEYEIREATSFHFGPLRLTMRLLYNLTPVNSDGIFIECGNTKHYWHNNPLFIFDDTLMHRSVNEHDARRYCMFVDVVRPSPFTGLIATLVEPVTAIAEPFKHLFYKKWKMLK